MIRNFFTIAWRNIWKNKMFSFINIAGLGIGMACTIMIFLWVQYEKSWNKTQANYSQVYQGFSTRNFNGELTTGSDLMFPLPKAAKENFPEVEGSTLVSYGENTLFTAGEKKIKRPTITVTSDFFDVFSYDFVHGDPSAIKEPDGIILTESTAKAIFNNTDVVGKILELNRHRSVTVRGVIKDIVPSSTLVFDAIIPFNLSSDWIKQSINDWVNCNNRTFYKVKNGTNIAQLEQKFLNLIKKNSPSENPTTRGSLLLQPMSKWRLYEEFRDGKNTGGRIQYVNLFTWIAIIILIIACVNFMNLSTARSEKRAREVGIRKTLGSEKKQLLAQFLCESLLMTIFAFVFAACIIYVGLPPFNRLLKQEIPIPFAQAQFWFYTLGIIIVTGLIAGSYPAFYLSAMKPVKVLKGSFLPGKRALLPRRVLVTAQFAVSIILISATLIIYQQIKHVQNRDLGYDTNNLIMVTANNDAAKNYEVLKNSLLASGLIEAVNVTSLPVSDIFGFTSGVRWVGAPEDPNLVIGFLGTGENFTNIMKAKMIEGRDFKAGDSSVVMFNKEAIRVMKLKNPIGSTITWGGREKRITGIIDDLIMTSPFALPIPLMISYEPNWVGSINIRVKEGADVKKALALIENNYKKYIPEYPFEYKFADTTFNDKFANEQLIARLAFLFASLAIFICCLGLFGLVSFSIERRTKEIGIRKILGASVQSLLTLMSKEFFVLVLISFAIAIPIAWWLMSEWLSNFSYRINMGIGIFFLVGCITLLICMITVGLNAFKTATSNPVKSLRTE
ncbi:MAG: ABC transporter permease [Sediminibacterium sp.]|nr:ABC transporter permease [uncultured Sediminibacterium sp.]